MGGKALQRAKTRGCQHLGVPSCVGQSPFSPAEVFTACSGVGETSLGSSFEAGASTETSSRLRVTSTRRTALGMLSPGGVSGGGCGAGRWGKQPRSRAPRLSPRQEINN